MSYTGIVKKVVAIILLLSGVVTAQASTPETVIDVMGVYSKTVADYDPEARLSSMIAYSNRALANSKANLRYRLVNVQEVNFPGDGSVSSTALNALKSNAKVRSLRVKYGADMVTMITKGIGGIAYMPLTYGQLGNAFSVVSHRNTAAMAHELGHNLSLGHSVRNGSGPKGTFYEYGRGHGVPGVFSTLMTYERDFGAPYVPYFSNPNIRYQGLPMGVPAGQPNAADAVRVINSVAPAMAKQYPTRVANPDVLDTDSEDLLHNGNMEIREDPRRYSSWGNICGSDKYTGMTPATERFEGKLALRVNNHDNICELMQYLGTGVLTPGMSYEFSAMMKVAEGPLDQLKVSVDLTRWEILSSSKYTRHRDWFDLTTDMIVKNQWVKVKGRITLPEDKKLIGRQLVISVEGSQPYLIDDVKLLVAGEYIDTIPDYFKFQEKAFVDKGVEMISNSITIKGINAPTDITVTGGEYRINGGDWMSVAAKVNEGDKVEVCHVSSQEDNKQVDTLLSVGDVSVTFRSTSRDDTLNITENPDRFVDMAGVRKNQVVTSNAITMKETIRIVVLRGTVSINGGGFIRSSGSNILTVKPGDKVRLRHTASDRAGIRVSTTMYLGSYSRDMKFASITRKEVVAVKPIKETTPAPTPTPAPAPAPPAKPIVPAKDITPDGFNFSSITDATWRTHAISNSITVSGINARTVISLTGRGKYSINGGAFTRKKGKVSNGDRVRVRNFTAGKGNVTRTTTLTIGGVSAVFTSITKADTDIKPDTTPDQFHFVDPKDVPKRIIAQTSITVSGINTKTHISVSRGKYSINNSPFTKKKGWVNNGDVVSVQHKTARKEGGAVSTTLTIGGVSDVFTTTTKVDTDVKRNESALVSEGSDGKLVYTPFANHEQTNKDNILPDWSHAGYMGGGVAIPDVPVVKTISPGPGDDFERIQGAIDYVESLPLSERGAILLTRGHYEVNTGLTIQKSGVVLRGQGQGMDGTVITATKQEKHTLITLGRTIGFKLDSSSRSRITTAYVGLGATSFDVESTDDYAVGDLIGVVRTPNQTWLEELGVAELDNNRDWTVEEYTTPHPRKIIEINGNTITIDIPLVDVMEVGRGGGEIQKASYSPIEQCGVENMRLRSVYASDKDEDHCANGIVLKGVQNSWVRQVTAQHFILFGISTYGKLARFNTIEDCAVIDHKSLITGTRRYSLNAGGNGNLFQRCYVNTSRHAFVANTSISRGPNVFLDCYSTGNYVDSSPHMRWVTGLLYDNIYAGRIQVRKGAGGHGWKGAQIMYWNMIADKSATKGGNSPLLEFWSPPGLMNWNIGTTGENRPEGDGYWEHYGSRVTPRSLYLKQLEDRLGAKAVANVTIPEQRGDEPIFDMLKNWAGEGNLSDWADFKEVVAVKPVKEATPAPKPAPANPIVPAKDITPDGFSFRNITDATWHTHAVSNVITVRGINDETVISLTGPGKYSINGGGFTRKKGVVSNGDRVRVRHITVGKGNVTRSTTLTIGAVSAVFTSITKADTDVKPETTPNQSPPVEYPEYAAGTIYSARDIVQNNGELYQCKNWPYSGWCQLAAYEPGVSAYWIQAWEHIEKVENPVKYPVDPTVDPSVDPLERAIKSGDPTLIDNAETLLDAAIAETDRLKARRNEFLQTIYGNDRIDYQPGKRTQLIIPNSLSDDVLPLLLGNKNKYLATAWERNGVRVAAFGSAPISQFQKGKNLDFEQPFTRLLAWLIKQDSATATPLNQSFDVALSYIEYWSENDTSNWIEENLPLWQRDDCNDVATLDSCYSGKELIIIGRANGTDEAGAITAALERAMANGAAVLYLHGYFETTSKLSDAIAGLFGFTTSGAGNYWSNDSAAWTNSDEMLSASPISAISPMLAHFKARDYVFDWSKCQSAKSCTEAPGIMEGFYDGARKLKNTLASMDSQGVQVFEYDGARLLKLLVLLGDKWREQIQYPLDKTLTDTFMKGYFADHAVYNNRTINPAQTDLGSFSNNLPEGIKRFDRTIEVTSRTEDYFTAAGVYALPGQTMVIERLDDSATTVKLFINTQRSGSTHEFNPPEHIRSPYDRPKYLSSARITLEKGQPFKITSPYGGPVQIWVDRHTDNPVTTRIRLRNVAQHPVWNGPETSQEFLAGLDSGVFNWAEFKTDGFEIHSRLDLMKKSLNSPLIGGNIDELSRLTLEYFYQNIHNLAGYQGQDLNLSEEVADFCSSRGWDCVNSKIHGLTRIKHMNADRAVAGYGTAGNPYDAFWAFNPLGWGDAHEIGHWMQPGRLRIYGGVSGETSNNIFPLHTVWQYRKDTGDTTIGNKRQSCPNKKTFDWLQQAALQADPIDQAYNQIWDSIDPNHGERLTFYEQLVQVAKHSGQPQFTDGWELYPLLYLLEREFGQAVQNDAIWLNKRDALGFGSYIDRPSSLSGNDFMLIATSYIIGQDMQPFFDMWGITYSIEAAAQVDEYGYPAADKLFYASEDFFQEVAPANILPVDGTQVWPFPSLDYSKCK